MSQKRIKRLDPTDRLFVPHVIYQYDEARANLDVEYNETAKQIIISGGRNGFARLAELLASWTEAGVTFEDEHWFRLKSPGLGLTFFLLGSKKAK